MTASPTPRPVPDTGDGSRARANVLDLLTAERFARPDPGRYITPVKPHRSQAPAVPIVYVYDDITTAVHRRVLREACGLLPLRDVS